MNLLFDLKRTLGYSLCRLKKRVLTSIFLSKKPIIKFQTSKTFKNVNLNLKESSAPNRQYYTWVLPWGFSLTFVFPC